MDQNNEQFRPEDQNPPPAQAGVEYYTTSAQPEEPTPKPRNKKALLISLLSAGGVLVAAAVLALVLFLPILATDPLGNTVEQVFFDPAVFSQLTEQWETAGAESEVNLFLPSDLTGLTRDLVMNLKATEQGSLANAVGHTTLKLTFGKHEVSLGVYYSPEMLAIQGLYEDPQQFLSVPRKNLRGAMEASVFHPESGSDYALDAETYEELATSLEELEELQSMQDTQTEEFRKLMESLTPVIEGWSEILTPESRIAFAKGAFALERRVEYRVDANDLNEMINLLLSTAQNDPTLNEYFFYESDGESSETLAQMLVKLKEAIPPTYEITFSYTVRGGYIDRASLSILAQETEAKQPETYVADLVFTYGEGVNGFTLTSGEKKTPDGALEDTMVLTYEKTEEEGATLVTLKITEGEETSEGSLRLDHTSHTYTLTLKEVAPETDAVIEGTLELDPATGVFRFSLDKVHLGKEALLEDTVISISSVACQTPPALSAPAAAALLSVTEAELTAFLRQIPLYNVEDFFHSVTGQSFGTVYTLDQQILYNVDACMDLAKDYQNRFVRMLAKTDIPVAHRVFIYNEELDVYVLLSYTSSTGMLKIDFAYEMTESRLKSYHEAVPDDSNGLIIHELTELSYVAPVCDQFGQRTFHCSVCNKDYVVEISPLGHKRELDTEKSYDATCDTDGLIVEVCIRCGDALENPIPAFGHAGTTSLNMKVTTDDNEERYLALHTCNTCGEHYSADVSDFATVYLKQLENGTYTVTEYQVSSWMSNSQHIQIPEDLIEQAGITALSPEATLVPAALWSAATLRVPSFMTTLPTDAFVRAKELQVIVLPSTVTTIESGAFYKSIPLHVIYFEGTEEQWNAVQKNEYAELWKNVAVIFCPEGASAKTVSTSYLKASIVEGAVSIAKDLVNGSAAGMEQLVGAQSGLIALSDRQIQWVTVDPETGRIAFCTPYNDATGITEVRVLGTDGTETHVISIPGIVSALAVGSDYVVAATGQGDEVSVHTYRLSDGEQMVTKIGSQYKYQYVDQMFIVGDRVFLTQNDQHCQVVNFFLSTKKFLNVKSAYGPTLMLSPDRTRLLVITASSHKQVFLIDTATAKVVGTVDAGNGKGISITVHGSYIALSDGTLYDLNGQVITQRPEDPTVSLLLPWNYMTLEELHASAAGRAYLSIDTRYVVQTVLKNAAGQTRELGIYAEAVLFTPDGNALVYTPNGYGLLYVEMHP